MTTGRVRRCLALFAGTVTLISGAAAVVQPPPAAAAGTPSAPIDLAQEPFSYAQPYVPARWSLPALPSGGANGACLTASTSTTQTPVPGCGGSADAPGSGALRLTPASLAQEGGVSSASSLPTSAGLDFTFDTYQYGELTGTAADGLLFYLAATDPSSPQPVTSLGGTSADLGYTSGNGAGNGLTDGYLGVGLDVYGGYSASSADGGGCTDPSWAAASSNTVTVRGPGAGTQGYCLLSSTEASGSLRGSLSTTASIRQGAGVPVEVALNPTSNAATTAWGLTVPAYSYLVAVTPIGSATQSISGPLPDDTSLPPADSSWANSSTGIPYQLDFGFAGTTGAGDDVHEISNLAVAPLASTAPPVLSVSMSDDDAGRLAVNTTVHYRVNAAVSSSGGSEASAPNLVAAVPAGVALTGASGTDWSCTDYAPYAKCAWTGALPVAAGTNLSAVTVTGTVSASTGTQTATAEAWEDGALGASTTDVGAAYSSTSVNPALQVVLTDTAGGQFVQGATATYVATALVSADGVAEADAPSLSVALPSMVSIGTVSAPDWSCSTGSQTVSCTWSGGTARAGTTLTPVAISTQVTGGGGGEASAALGSTDAGTATTVYDWGAVASAPQFTLAVADDKSGDLPSGNAVTYTATVGTAAAGAVPTHEPVVSMAFPGLSANYFSAVSEDASSTDWSCASTSATIPVYPGSALVETCTYVTGLPAGAGSALQALVFDATVGSSATTDAVLDVSGSVASNDSGPAVGNDYARVGAAPVPNFSLSASAPASAPGNYTLTATAGVLGTGGPMTSTASIIITLPAGESFPATPSSTGWGCKLESSSTVADCTSATSSYSAGSSLPTLQATVSPSAVGLHTVEVELTDGNDSAFPVWTSATTGTSVPVLALGASEPSAASAGSKYALTLTPSIDASGGQAYQQLSLGVTLPAGGESFNGTPSAPGWACSIGGPDNNVLTCTYSVSSSDPVTPGTNLAAIGATVLVATGASGVQSATATFSSPDTPTSATRSLSVTVTSAPALSLSASAPGGASAGSTFTLTMTAGLGTAGGVAYNDPVLSLSLPAAESIPATAPTAPGWSCAVPGTNGAALTCTSTASTSPPIAAGTSLGSVSVQVTLASDALSSNPAGIEETATVQVADTADDATGGTQVVKVNVTPPPVLDVSIAGTPSGASAGTSYQMTVSASVTSAGPAYHDPQLTVALPSGETFASAPSGAGWSCSLATSTSATCNSTASTNISVGSLGQLTATVDIGPLSVNETTVSMTSTATISDTADAATSVSTTSTGTVTPPPVLKLVLSGTPAQARVGTYYTLTATAGLSSSGGPAYHDPAATLTVPAGETFASPLGSEPGWNCTPLVSPYTSVTCTSTDGTPLAAGNSLGTITATVNVGSAGTLTTDASMADPADMASAASATATVDATAVPVLGLTTSGTPTSAQPGTSYQVDFVASVDNSGGPTYNQLRLNVSLPPNEIFASQPTVTGWTCQLSVQDAVLTCTTGSSSIAAGTTLTTVTATVDIGGNASGTLTTTATLSDTSDAATSVTVTAAVDVVTPSTNPGIFFPPSPPILVTTTTAAPTTTTTTPLPGGSTTTTVPKGGTTTTVPGKGGTTTTTFPGETTTTLPGGGNGADPPPSGATPILELVASAPASAVAGGKFVVKVTVGLSPKGGAAYSSPSFSIDLPAGSTWDKAKIGGSSKWGCTISDRSSVLVCVWQGPVPLAAGTPMGTVYATVELSPVATGTLVVPVTLSDTADLAKTVTAVLKIAILGPPVQPGKNAGGPARGRSGPRVPASNWGYRLMANQGGVFAFRGAKFHGSCQTVTRPCGRFHIPRITGGATAPRSQGYWLVGVTGAVFSFGGAHFEGSCPQTRHPCGKLHSAVVGMAPTPSGRGYWLAAANGSVFSFGDAKSYGSCTATPRLCPGKRDAVVGIAATPDGKGYWLVALNGEVFSFGDATRSLACRTSAKNCGHLFGEIAGVATAPRGKGYWLVNRGGRIFAFGSAHFWGDTYSIRKHRAFPGKVAGMAATGNGNGYWLVTVNGYVLAVGGAGFAGDISTTHIKKLHSPIVAIAAT